MSVLGVLLASVGAAIVLVALLALVLCVVLATAADRRARAGGPRYCRGRSAADRVPVDARGALIPNR